ncbi:DUF3168 domain-containing protein [Marinitenerispora sediminis]|uniref:DUF3168 domain-containing protein n=1 Tax=Marinitenerispora sediminis TaxID=1931232 RepID=A0A368T6D7_9ACTN|nr:DUF3168 domain-containing protein [Marinitenerispora sediminis]RCV53471.1 hypothetical protein DEF23_17480 [Marinitenerispora sediminis]RCV59299.1 hypothetical protein DEF24_10020 [Marinitenerispora sediminis]
MARLLPRVDALLVGILRPALGPGVTVGTRIPDQMPLPFVMARRAGGASIHPRFLDQALVDVQVWAGSDAEAEGLAQAVRDALYEASTTPQVIVPGMGYLSWFAEQAAPVLLPSDTEDHNVYRYQATYQINTRPDLD